MVYRVMTKEGEKVEIISLNQLSLFQQFHCEDQWWLKAFIQRRHGVQGDDERRGKSGDSQCR